MMDIKRMKIVIGAMLITTMVCTAQVPLIFNLQGRLVLSNGVAVTNRMDICTMLYTNATVGSNIWSNTYSAVVLDKGYYNLSLGIGGGLSITNTFPGNEYYIGVKFKTNSVGSWSSELLPRARLLPAAQAVDATKSVSATVAGTATNAYMLSNLTLAAIINLITPPGTITAFGGMSAPSGWVICDGTTLSRSEYPNLFAAIGTNFGAGDETTTFNLPDFRGRFLRGVDTGTSRDPEAGSRAPMAPGGNQGDNVGSIQDDVFGSHSHDLYCIYYPKTGSGWTWAAQPREGYYGPAYTTPSGGTETRPKNANVYYIIKY